MGILMYFRHHPVVPVSQIKKGKKCREDSGFLYTRIVQIITIFIRNIPVVRVDKGDIFTVAGGLVVILLIAMIANPAMLSPLLPVSGSGPAVQETTVPAPEPTVVYAVSPTPTPVVNLTPQPPGPPYRILYTNNPFTYPVIHLPDHMETFGASDIPLRDNATVSFAYVEDSRGGLTTIFSVPYEAWALNISVTANRQPQYAMFRMVLCDAKTGTIITGAEIQNGGTMYKVVRNSGSMYLIISVAYVDSFRITLETPLSYYEKAGSGT